MDVSGIVLETSSTAVVVSCFVVSDLSVVVSSFFLQRMHVCNFGDSGKEETKHKLLVVVVVVAVV